MARSLRWGIVGSGAMAEAFVRDLRYAPSAIAAGVASRSEDRAHQFAGRCGVEKAYAGVEDLVSCSEIDVIYVASLNHQHAEHALAAIEARKPVLCEKPFATSAMAAREVADRARDRKVFCMEAMWSRFMPGMVRLRTLVRGGVIGEARMLSVQIGYPFAIEPAGRLWDPEKGGGAMLDLGVYPLSLAIDLLGPVESVSGDCSICETGVDDRVGMVLHHTSGGMSMVSASISCSMSNEAVVSGDAGLIRVHEPFYRPARLTVKKSGRIRTGQRAARPRLISRLGESLFGRTLIARFEWMRTLVSRSSRSIVLPHAGGGYQYQVAEVARCLEEGRIESEIMPLDHSIAVLEAIDLIRFNGRSRLATSK